MARTYPRLRRVAARWQAYIRSTGPPFRTFMVLSVIVAYGIAALGVVVGLLFTDKWLYGSLSIRFVMSTVIIPFLAIAFAFAIQIIALFKEADTRTVQRDQQSLFLAAMERAHATSMVSQVFFGHLLHEWDGAMKKLEDGVVTIQRDYWRVCGDLYELARRRVDCTSLEPIGYWDDASDRPPGSENQNDELLDYYEKQRVLINRGIEVRRTFILRSDDLQTQAQQEQLLRVVTKQLSKHHNFHVYYVWLDDFADPELKGILGSDFALIDGRVLMLGNISKTNQNVYNYDFYDLQAVGSNPELHKPALRMFGNPSAVTGVDPAPQLVLDKAKARKCVTDIPFLADPVFLAYKDAIEGHVRRLGYA